MRVLRGHHHAWDPPQDGAAVAVGVFDGVHRGHRALLDRARQRAAELGGLPLTVLTFDPHPMRLVDSERAPQLLTTMDRRIELLAEAGVEICAVLPFTEEVRHLDPEGFAADVLVGALGASLVAIGADFRFGWDRSGDVDTLRTVGLGLGYFVEEVPMTGGEAPISSSRIRAALRDGDVAAAAELLGRPYDLTGTVVEGERRGVSIGFPTANIDLPEEMLIPARGVYAVRARVEGDWENGVANIGVRPTFGGDREVVEVHLLDFEGDLYGQELRVQFVARLRDERRFDGVEELAAQIGSDVDEGRRLLEQSSR